MRRAGQPGLFDTESQPDLFGGAGAGRQAYVPDPRHVRNRLADMLERMRGAESWPWSASTRSLYRQTVWPYLLARLPDAEEAARWRSQIEAEAARLDRAEG